MVGLNILFVVVLRKEVLGIFQANLLSAAAMFLVLALSFFRRVRMRLSWVQMKALLLFGIPLMPTQIASWVLTLSDRYLLKYLVTLKEVGVYTLGYNLGFVVNLLIVGPFSVAWGPFMYKVARGKGASETYARTLTYIGLVSATIALLLSLFAPLLVRVIAPPAYYPAHRIIPLVAFSYVLYGMYFVFTAGLNITKRTYYFPLIVGLAAGLNIVLNLILIPRYRMMAAAGSTFFCYLLLALMTGFCSQRFYRVRYEYARLLKIAMALAIVLAAGLATHSYSGLSGLVLKVLLFLMFPVLLYVFSFFREGEVTKLLGIIKLR
jgi:O-antigen/teichoic acid export membrane protein